MQYLYITAMLTVTAIITNKENSSLPESEKNSQQHPHAVSIEHNQDQGATTSEMVSESMQSEIIETLTSWSNSKNR